MNPVLWRELRVSARRPRVGWLITGGLWFCLIVVWLVSTEVSEVVIGTVGTTGAGRVLVGVLVVTLATLVALVAPFVAVRALALERRRRTFDLLIITPLTARVILRGKLLGALMPLFVILGATLPLAMLLRLYGGFTAGEVLWGYVFLFEETIVFGLFGLAAAVLGQDRPRLAAFGLIVLIAFILIGTPIADMALGEGILWWLKLPVVLTVLLWLVTDTARRLTTDRATMDDASAEIRQAWLLLFFGALLMVGLLWDIQHGGPTLRYANPLLAASSLAGLPVWFEPARGNFSVCVFLYFLLPGAMFPMLAARLQTYFNAAIPNERGLFF